jgi:hypothetical protein
VLNHYHIAGIQTNGVSVGIVSGASTNRTWTGIRSNGTVYAASAENLAINSTPEQWVAQHYPATNDFNAVEHRGNLQDAPAWTHFADASAIPGDGTEKAYTNALAGATNRFYRVRVSC